MSRVIGVAALLLAGGACAPNAVPEPPEPAAAPAAFPTTPPVPGPAPALSVPNPEVRTLPNGLRVLYVRQAELPVVHATLVTRGGMVDAPADLPELASFAADMLDEGAGGRGALELASAVESLGASLSTFAGWDAVQLDLEVLRPRFAEALPLLADVATRPDFPEAEVSRMRERRLTELARAKDEARVIAGNAFASLLFGTNHPYGRLASTGATRSISRDDLVRFHRAFYGPASSTLILVGDVDPAAMQPVVEGAFAGWQAPSAAPVAVPEPAAAPATRVVLIDKPGAAQSEIRIGHPGIARSNPDYYPLMVLNTLLGGSFTSRLNTNLREVHGYSYGARSSFAARRGTGPFEASSAVVTAKTDSALIEFFHELRRIRTEDVPADELERAKRYLALGMPRRFETTGDVAGQLADLQIYGLATRTLERAIPEILAVTAADVRRVANTYLRPDRSVVVVVGDRKIVEPGIRALSIGAVEVREASEFVN